MARRRFGERPRFSLDEVRLLIAAGAYRITGSAADGAGKLYLDEDDIVECVASLTEADYEQTLESHKLPGTFQDVYKPRRYGFALYVKIRVADGVPAPRNRLAVIISFKRDESV